MFSKLWLTNIILAAFAIFFGIRTHDVWVEKKDKTVSETQTMQGRENRHVEKRFLKKDVPNESAYKVIAEKNLFSPDRAEYIPPEEPEPEAEVKPLLLSGQKITLFGVIIMDDYKSALISNPIREPGERENKWVKEGDMLGELTVNAIKKESILLTEKDKKYEILLYDAKKPALKNESVKQETTTPTVVISESEKKTAPAASKGDKVSAPPEDEYETITTPFGTYRRKKK